MVGWCFIEFKYFSIIKLPVLSKCGKNLKYNLLALFWCHTVYMFLCVVCTGVLSSHEPLFHPQIPKSARCSVPCSSGPPYPWVLCSGALHQKFFKVKFFEYMILIDSSGFDWIWKMLIYMFICKHIYVHRFQLPFSVCEINMRSQKNNIIQQSNWC